MLDACLPRVLQFRRFMVSYYLVTEIRLCSGELVCGE